MTTLEEAKETWSEVCDRLGEYVSRDVVRDLLHEAARLHYAEHRGRIADLEGQVADLRERLDTYRRLHEASVAERDAARVQVADTNAEAARDGHVLLETWLRGELEEASKL